jgi:UDP-N-acetylmuramoylalanine--D-glutamate ligase
MICDQKKRIVVGLGLTGQSYIRYLNNLGLKFSVVDNRESPPNIKKIKDEFPSLDLYLGKKYSSLLGHADEIYLSPGISINDPFLSEAKQNSVKIINDIDLFVGLVSAPIVLITGSNGKSTVTQLVGMMAKEAGINAQVGGNIGRPVLDILSEDCELYILELSSFQLEMCSNLSSLVSCILNITEDHLDRHGTLQNYINIKKKIYKNSNTCIFNRDDSSTYPSIDSNNSISFGLDKADKNNYGLIKDNDATYISKGEIKLINKKILSLSADHNVLNIMSAVAIARSLEINITSITSAINKFNGLPHRCEKVAQISGVTFYNDSKATNIGATIAAIKGFAKNLTGKLIILIGGRAKQDDFSKLFFLLETINHQLILFGESVEKILSFSKSSRNYIFADTIQSATDVAFSESKYGDIVLLSPACSSYDMFSSFEERGDVFRESVLTLSKKVKSEVIH